MTGCGNSIDTSEPGVLRMVLDSLRYWVTEMGVDGFRFDLVSTLLRDERHHVDQEHPFKTALRNDPVLSGVKLIAEPWDMGPYGYQFGAFGRGWSEWNDRYRNHVRDFWRGETHGVSEFALRLSGSPDIFDRDGRPTTRVSTSSPLMTASPCATWSPTTSSTTAPTASRIGTEPRTTGPGTAGSKGRPTMRR